MVMLLCEWKKLKLNCQSVGVLVRNDQRSEVMATVKQKKLTLTELKRQVIKLQKKEDATRTRLRAALLKVDKLGRLLKSCVEFDKNGLLR